jgi:hypothetical protein
MQEMGFVASDFPHSTLSLLNEVIIQLWEETDVIRRRLILQR